MAWERTAVNWPRRDPLDIKCPIPDDTNTNTLAKAVACCQTWCRLSLWIPSPILLKQWRASLQMLPRFRIWTMSKNITGKMIFIQLNSLPFPRGEISAPPEGISIIFFFHLTLASALWSCGRWHNDCGARRETSPWSKMTALHTHPITGSAIERSSSVFRGVRQLPMCKMVRNGTSAGILFKDGVAWGRGSGLGEGRGLG